MFQTFLERTEGVDGFAHIWRFSSFFVQQNNVFARKIAFEAATSATPPRRIIFALHYLTNHIAFFKGLQTQQVNNVE